MPTGDRPRLSAVQSVDRAVSILEMLAEFGAAGVTEIASELAVNKSTVFRLLMTLEARGLVVQDSERGKYRVGRTAVLLAAGASKVRDIVAVSRPVSHELAASVGETVSVAVPDGTEVLTVDEALGSAAVTTVDHVGTRASLHATAAGKVFLAEMTSTELDALIAPGLTAHTSATITDAAELQEQLALVRKLGYATTYEEYEVGLTALAMPIRTLGGGVIAALTISGPSFRANERTLPQFLAPLEAAAAKISWRCGYVKRG